MKIPILIFILYVHYSTSQNVEDMKKPLNSYPKKVRTGLVQYNNAGKYVKLLHPTLKPKKSNIDRDYTAFAKPFPKSEENKPHHQIVPDSPYFPVDDLKPPERRSRVKKVLPEYPLPSRSKRSADEMASDKEKQLKAPPQITGNTKADGDANANSVAGHATPLKTTEEVGVADKKFAKNLSSRPEKSRLAKARYNRIGKKKGLFKGLAEVGKNQKLRDRRNRKLRLQERLKKKNSRPGLARAKKLKSHKKLSGGKLGRKLKSGARGQSKLRNKKLRGVPASNSSSKVRSARNMKGRSGRRLIAARDGLIDEYPYAISIQKDGQHWCSGAILNPRLIITTANCLWRSNSMSRMRVRAGSRHTDRGGQLARIQEVMKHPGWKLRKNPDNDVALALLDKNIKFSHGLHGVDLPNRVMLPPFDDAWVTSWGADRRDGIFDTRGVNLQVYHTRLIDREKCNNMTLRFGIPVTENFICLSQTGARAPCTRDTGAPAVSDGVLWGLASWGIRKMCGTERFPAMFSYLASQTNMDFIVNATHYLMSEERNYPFPDRYPVRRVSITTPTLMTLPH